MSPKIQATVDHDLTRPLWEAIDDARSATGEAVSTIREAIKEAGSLRDDHRRLHPKLAAGSVQALATLAVSETSLKELRTALGRAEAIQSDLNSLCDRVTAGEVERKHA